MYQTALCAKRRWSRSFLEDQYLTVSRSTVARRFIAASMLAFSCCLGTQSVADDEFHNGTGHSHRSWQAERNGWGWDSRSGWYVGPFFRRNSHGYFRCFDAGSGWHSCPYYLTGYAALKLPKETSRHYVKRHTSEELMRKYSLTL